MSDYGIMAGRYPAIVKSYSQTRRTCRVEIPGLTEGGDVLPEAEIEYPIGEKSRAGVNPTEIEITPGDTVWVAFIGGDARYPIITGWRNPQAGNSVDWRRWHHKNVEMLADSVMNLIAGGDVLVRSGTHVTVQAPSITLDAPQTTCTGKLTVNGLLTYQSGMSGAGGAAVTGGDITADGMSLKAHHHTAQGSNATTSPAQT